MRTGTQGRDRGGFLRILILCGLTLCTACEQESAPTPNEILGVWRTDAPRHVDRTFEIRDDAIVFGTGKFSAPRLHVLLRVESKPDLAGWKVCTLFYREYDGTIAELDLEYQAQPSPKLRFPNREEFWVRSERQEDQDA